MLQRLSERGVSIVNAAALRIKRILEKAEGCARVRMALFFMLLALIGGVMFLLNSHTPLMMDDYDYSVSWATGERIDSLFDVLASQKAHYFLWGGRSVVHTLAQLFLSVDKAVFSAANTLMYLALLLVIYALARPKERAYCWSILLAAHAFLFTCVPFFGTVFLWLTGSCNYLWGTVLALLPLLMIKSFKNGGFFARHGYCALPICFIAGWTNENTACGVFAILFVFLALEKLQGNKTGLWPWAALLAHAAGVAVMLVAPGNYARASAYETGNIVLELLRRAVVATVYGGVYVGVLLVAVLMLWALCGAMGAKRRSGQVLLLLLGALGAAYAMVASPVFSDRSWTGVIALALCAGLLLLGDLEAHVRALDAARLLALPLAVLLIAYGGYKALGDVKAHEAAWLGEVQRIEAAAAAGEERVDARSVLSTSRFTMSVELQSDAALWPNATLSKSFGISVNGL